MTDTGFREATPLRSSSTGDPDVIATEIERTRGEMSETVNTIEQRLDPDRLSAQAVETASEVSEQAVVAATEITIQARDAAKDVTKYAIDEAKTAIRELADQATTTVRASTVGRVETMAANTRDTAQVVRADLWTTIKQNPVPAALAAIGIGWLWSHRASGDRYTGQIGSGLSSGWNYAPYGSVGYAGYGDHGYGYGAESGRLDEMTGQAKQVTGQVLDQVQEQAGQVKEQIDQFQGQVPVMASQMQQQARGFWEMVEDNPIAVGALGAVLGGIAGLVVPETEQERELMGESRDRVVGSVQEKMQNVADRVTNAQATAGDAIDKVQHVAQRAADAAVDEAKSQGMMPSKDKAGSRGAADLR